VTRYAEFWLTLCASVRCLLSFGHFLLTKLLMDTLISSRARIVNVSSLGHSLVPALTYPKQNNKATYDRSQAYADSKLANIYFTTELERRYGNQGVHAFSCHPGFVISELDRHVFTGPLRFLVAPVQALLYKVSNAAGYAQGAPLQMFCRSRSLCLCCLPGCLSGCLPACFLCVCVVPVQTSLEGAQTTLFCALSDSAIPGGYHADTQPRRVAPAAKDASKAAWLWEESERVTKLK
jgi:hypothetical protein